MQRPLKVYAFDPSLGRRYGNYMTVKVGYEKLEKGPRGRRVEVIDYDASNKRYYQPVDLDSPDVLDRRRLRVPERGSDRQVEVAVAVEVAADGDLPELPPDLGAAGERQPLLSDLPDLRESRRRAHQRGQRRRHRHRAEVPSPTHRGFPTSLRSSHRALRTAAGSCRGPGRSLVRILGGSARRETARSRHGACSGKLRAVRRLRLTTAGESHGPGLTAILEGIPAGLAVDFERLAREMKRRQHGYGRGRRMQIESDEVEVRGEVVALLRRYR